MTAQEQLRLLREVVAAAVNHLAGGGHIKRGDQFFQDLKKVHRATRDLQNAPETLEAEHWQNVACGIAYWAGLVAYRTEGPWSVVLDSLLENGGTQLNSAAIALAGQLGIELRESGDGGKTWVPIAEFRAQLEQYTDEELLMELKRRRDAAQKSPEEHLQEYQEVMMPSERLRTLNPLPHLNPVRVLDLGMQIVRNETGQSAAAWVTHWEFDNGQWWAEHRDRYTGDRLQLRELTDAAPLPRPALCRQVDCTSLAVPGNTGLCNRHWLERTPVIREMTAAQVAQRDAEFHATVCHAVGCRMPRLAGALFCADHRPDAPAPSGP